MTFNMNFLLIHDNLFCCGNIWQCILVLSCLSLVRMCLTMKQRILLPDAEIIKPDTEYFMPLFVSHLVPRLAFFFSSPLGSELQKNVTIKCIVNLVSIDNKWFFTPSFSPLECHSAFYERHHRPFFF